MINIYQLIKASIKINKMKTNKQINQNPQKQQHVNILGYLSGPKLYKRQNQSIVSPKIEIAKNRKSPISTNYQFERDTEPNDYKNSMSGKNTFRSQKIPPNKQEIQDFYTSRNYAKQPEMRVKFLIESSKVNNIKDQVNSAPRNRFYYKQEYDSQTKTQKQHQKNEEWQEKYQYQKILPGYISKLNAKFQATRQQNSNTGRNRRQGRSKSPLEQSHQHLFAKCYKQTSQHLHLMLKEIHQSQDNLGFVHQEIMDTVRSEVKERGLLLKEKLIDLVQEIMDEWESNELLFLKNNQILFMDDILQLEEQLNQKQSKINCMIQKLQDEKESNWTENKSNVQRIKSETVWKNVTTDLLMFNYENSIIEIQELAEKIFQSVPQKCDLAIGLLPFSSSLVKQPHLQIQRSYHSQIKSSQILLQIKQTIVKILQQSVDSNKKQRINKSIQKNVHLNRKRQNFTLSSFINQKNP